ncbi:MAG: CinA family protein [Pontixanthobacter sp.]
MAEFLQDVHGQAGRIAALLRARGETIAIADGATGGLVTAALLTVPGALDFFIGGGVVYSLRARDVLFDLPSEAYRGMRGATEDYARLQAESIANNFRADWGLAESGSAGGGSRHPTGAAPGRSCAAMVGPDGSWATTLVTGKEDRIANMHRFAHAALDHCETVLRG